MIMSTRCCGFASLALLCTLAVICFQGVYGEDISGPTVTECRPHIERALKEQLQHGTADNSGSAEDVPTIEDDSSIEIPGSHPEEIEIASSENTVTVEIEGEISSEDTADGSPEDKSGSTEPTAAISAEDTETKSTEDAKSQADENVGEKSAEDSKTESGEVSEAASAEDEAQSVEDTVESAEEQAETEETAENKSEEVSEEPSDNKSDEADVKSSETEKEEGEKSVEAADRSGEDGGSKSAEELEEKIDEADAKSGEDEVKSGEDVAKSEEGDSKSEEVVELSDKTEDQSGEVETKSEEDTGKSTENIVHQSAEDEKSAEEHGAPESAESKETQSAEAGDTESGEHEEVEEIHVREERSAVSAEKGEESLEAQAESGEQGSVPDSDETQGSMETADTEATSVESKEGNIESAEVQQAEEGSQSEEEASPKDEDSKEEADKSLGEESSEKQDAPEDTTAEVAESSETIEQTVEHLRDEPDLDVASGEKSAEKSDEAKPESGEQDEKASAETKSGKETEEQHGSTEEVQDVKKSSEEQQDDVVQDDQEQISDEKQESVETETGEVKESQEDDIKKTSEEEAQVEGKLEETEAEAAQEEELKDESEAASIEANPEDELTKEFLIPENLRNRDHLDQLLGLSDDLTESDLAVAKAVDTTLRELKRLYDSAIKPLEIVFKYRDLSNRHFGDPEIFSKPLVLFMGPWSGGKSSIINYLTNNEYNEFSLRTGAEPSPAYFNILMWGAEPEVLDGTQLAADWTFSGLQKFGQGLEDRLRGLKLPNKLLEKVNIVEIPGILEVRKQVSRVFPFNDACQWFIDRADIIFLVYDPSKLDVGPETEAILDQLKGREYQTRILLNKADTVKPEELMRVQGALIWNISPLMSSAQPPVMYTTSLWSNPFTVGSPERLLMAQERGFLRDLRQAIEKRVENKISSARRFAVRVRNHAKMVDCYLTTYYNHKTLFGNRKQISDAIIEHPQEYHIYEGLSTLTNISRYDLPDPDVYRDFFKLNPLYEFQQLSATCTYFRGCPINRLDVAIAYDLPELVGKYKKMVESALPSNKPNNS